jgi:hypothetical protein
MRKWLLRIGIFILLAIVFPFAGGLTIAYDEWSGTTERRYQFTGSSGQAPLPEAHSVVYDRGGIPDRYWYGYEPELLADIRGKQAETAIARIEELAPQYEYRQRYQVWPGPNSNTYIAHLLREIDELEVDLPATAIGKDYIERVGFMAAPSNTGFQFSAHGMLGLTLALDEGVEVNLLGASYGVDLYPPALKLPAIGRLGF